jgi:hypothetical protein
MKGGKGNTFSTSLNKSFFLSFFSRHHSYVSRLLGKSINRNSLLRILEKGGLTRASKRMCARAIAHATLIDIHIVVRRVTKWKMILLTRHKTMNENERMKENVQCDVQEHPLHRLQSRFNNQCYSHTI